MLTQSKFLQWGVWGMILLSISVESVFANDAPRKMVWNLQKTIPLNYIAEQSYGHRAYIKMIALYNGLDPDQMAPKGSVIKTPELPELFTDIGLLPLYEKPFRKIFFVIKQTPIYLAEYFTILNKADEKSEHVDLPDNISHPIALLASMLEKTVDEMEQMTQQTGDTPTMTLRQLMNAAFLLRRVAEGQQMHSKDVAMIEQHLAHALANAVAWSQE